MRFDLVLMRQASAYKGAIRSRPMFFLTSTLLNLICPGGCLAFLAPLDGNGAEIGHRFGCYARHVARLTGRHDLVQFPEVTAVARGLGWGAKEKSAGWGLVIVRPSQEPSDESVLARPIRSAADDAVPCCEWAAQFTPAARVSRKAA
jgi:hypothetical protein